MKITEQLLQDIERFLSRDGEGFGISEHKFGILTTNNHHLIENLRKGRGLHSTTVDKIYDFMKNYKKS